MAQYTAIIGNAAFSRVTERTYTHVVAIVYPDGVVRVANWCGSEVLAQKKLAAIIRGMGDVSLFGYWDGAQKKYVDFETLADTRIVECLKSA